MPDEMIPVAHSELTRLEERAKRLAREKSFLQLIIDLMNNISAVPGLENLIENLLETILNGIGGMNIILYYRANGEIRYTDVFGTKKSLASIEDPLVAKAMETAAPLEIEHDFADTRMLTPEFTKAHTWIYPLLVGSDCVGVLRMESLHISMHGLEQPLATFFAYVALVLKNEIASESHLREICDDLSAANRQLTHEIAERHRAAQELRQSRDELEDRVLDRTRELESANRVLESEVIERRQVEKALQWELSVTAAVARLYATMAAPGSTIHDIAVHILTEAKQLTGSPDGFVSEIDPATGESVGHTFAGVEQSAPPTAARRFVFSRGADGTYPGLLGRALNTRQPFLNNEPQSDALAAGWLRQGNLIQCCLAVPVMLGDSLVGMIALANKESGYTDRDLAAVRRIAVYYVLTIRGKRAEQTIRHLAGFPRLSPFMIAEFTRKTELVFANPAMESAMKRWGIANPRQFIPPDWIEKLGEPEPIEADVDVREIVVGERCFQVHFAFMPEFESLRIYANDVTERKQAETEQVRLREQLLQSQKMEAIGRLAGGVAHDFNNLLTVINGYSELALSRVAESDPLQPGLQQIHKAGEHAANLTQQLLAFSRRQPIQPRVLDVNAAVRDTEKLLRRLIGDDIELTCILDRDLASVNADPGQIHQVILNLVVNARDAMPSGGKLVIETRNVDLDHRYAANHWTVEPGSYVTLSVSDTGTGMDEETLRHVFEPFFTTKEMGKGTGLGLATVFGIVKQAGGHASVYSEPGRGTTFRIYLPRAEKTAASTGAVAPQRFDTRGQETVLVVEDQTQVRGLACAILRGCGYRVLEAANGPEALRLSDSYLGGIDLLVTDVVMPQMSGPKLAENLKALRPVIQVLYISGYTGNIALDQSGEQGSTNYLQKPFSTEGLARKVREILDAACALASKNP